MIGKRLAAMLAVVAMFGAACSKPGGGDYQGGGTAGSPNDSTGMNGGATSGSNSPAQGPGAGTAQGGAATTGAVPPVQPPTPSQTGPSDISTPSGSGTPANVGGTRDTTGKRP